MKIEPENIIPTKLSQLAIKFKHSKKRSEQNKLFIQIANTYMPYILSKMKGNVKPQDSDEFVQIYYIEVLKALTQWNMKSNFDTYLFLFIRGVYTKFMNSISTFKNKKVSVTCLSDLAGFDIVATKLEDNNYNYSTVKDIQDE